MQIYLCICSVKTFTNTDLKIQDRSFARFGRSVNRHPSDVLRKRKSHIFDSRKCKK